MADRFLELELLSEASRKVRARLAKDRGLLIGLLLAVGLAFSWFFAQPRQEAKEAGPQTPSLTAYEADLVQTMVEDGKPEAEARALVIAARPSEEERRRIQHTLDERKRETRAIQAQLCVDEPWLDRCD